MRRFCGFPVVLLILPLCGCASTWDTLTNRSFQRGVIHEPIKTLILPDDPLTVLRTNPDGDARAKAMRRLKEPLTNGGTQEEQAEALQYLSEAATRDSSPVIRVAAIDALGRFQDPRALEALAASYAQSTGTSAAMDRGRGTTGSAALLADRAALFGPSGFPPEIVSLLRCRSLTAMAATGQPEALQYITSMTMPTKEGRSEADREVRLAATQAIKTIRTPEAVQALARILAAESGRDVAISQTANEGLIELTGHQLPPDPEKWSAVIQAGFEVRPEPGMIQRVIGQLTP